MGACSFVEYREGITPSGTFQKLREDAEYEYGNDAYNGTISTTSLVKVNKFSEYKETKKRNREVNELIEKILDRCPKWSCECIDLGIVRYEKVSMKKAPLNSKKQYVVYEYGDEVGIYNTKREAEKHAEMLAVQDLSRVCVRCVSSISEVTTSVKVFKRKPSNMKNVRKVHKYIFVGWAAE